MSFSFDTPTNGCANGEFSVDATGEQITPPAGTFSVEITPESDCLYSRAGASGKFSILYGGQWATISGVPDGFWLKAATGTVAGDMDALSREASSAEP